MDLLGPLLKNEYTEEIYNFPEQDYGTVYTTLSVHWKPEIFCCAAESRTVGTGKNKKSGSDLKCFS